MKAKKQRFIVDGYNLLFRLYPHSTFNKIEDKRNELISALKTICRILSWECVIFFDAAYGSTTEMARGYCGDLEIIYSPKGISVDRLILDADIDFFKSSHLVTSDDRLARMMKLKGVKTITCESFSDSICRKLDKMKSKIPIPDEERRTRGAKPSLLPSLSDVDTWVQLFETKPPSPNDFSFKEW